MINTQQYLDKSHFDQFGTVAVIVDFTNSTDYVADVLAVLDAHKIAFKLFDIADPVNLYNRIDWQLIDQALILLGHDNPVAFGRIQGFLESLNINYSGPNLLAAALAADRIKSKRIWQISGIATPPFVKWQEPFDWQEILGLIGLPLVIKNLVTTDNRVFKINHIDQTKQILNKFDKVQDLILEPWITGDKYLVYIFNNQVLDPLKVYDSLNIALNPGKSDCSIHATTVSHSYHTINTENAISCELPVNLTAVAIKEMQRLACEAFTAIGGQGMAEVKILRDLNGDCWVLSINVSVAVAKDSNLIIAAAKAGFSFEQVVCKILETTALKKSNKVNSNP